MKLKPHRELLSVGLRPPLVRAGEDPEPFVRTSAVQGEATRPTYG
jgi:hypothetical protein